MSELDRLTGLVGFSGVKVPVLVASTANIATMAGLLTIDGVVLAQDDRILVKDQTFPVQNGIYTADTGTWNRAPDADGPYDFVFGSLVLVASGSINGGAVFRLTTTGTIIPGTSNLTFSTMGLLATPVPVASGGTGGITGNAALTNLTATRSETGGSAIPALTILRRVITPEDFGAVGNGVTDDLTPLTNFINALLSAIAAGTAIEGRMPAKIYAVSGALPNITVSGLRLIGCGPDFVHSVGTNSAGTRIKAITNSGFTILTVGAADGAGNQALSGIVIEGITFDGNSKAGKGVILKSIYRSRIDIAVLECTTTNIELNVNATLGDPTSAQFNELNFHSWATTNAAIPLRIIGSATGNWSLNKFGRVDIIHKDQIGVIVENADNNLWELLRIFQAGGGIAVNSIEWRGGATTAQSSRNETVLCLSATLAGICKGTGTYTVGAQNIVAELDKGNSTPNLTVETGSTGFDNTWRSTTPVPTPGTGAFTTVSTLVHTLYPAEVPAKRVHVTGYVVITAFGTGGSYIRVPLPVSQNALTAAAFTCYTNDGTPLGGFGRVVAGDSNLDIFRYDGATLAGANRTVFFSGTIEL